MMSLAGIALGLALAFTAAAVCPHGRCADAHKPRAAVHRHHQRAPASAS